MNISSIIQLLESLNDNTITITQLYADDGYPDRDEMIWDYVRHDEFDIPLEIKTIVYSDLADILMKQYQCKSIEEIDELLDKSQKRIVSYYSKKGKLSDQIIIICGDRIVDGNHRALAAVKTNANLKYVDLTDIH